MAVAGFLHFVTVCGTGMFVLLLWTTQSSNWIGKNTQPKSKKNYSRSLPAATRGVRACSVGHTVLLGNGKKKSCQAVAPAIQCALESQYRLSTCVLERPAMLMFLWYPAGLFVTGNLQLVCSGLVHPCCRRVWTGSLIANSRSWHFLITVCSCSPYSIIHILSKMLFPFSLERGNIFDVYDNINKLAFDYINKSLTLWEVLWLLFERS